MKNLDRKSLKNFLMDVFKYDLNKFMSMDERQFK